MTQRMTIFLLGALLSATACDPSDDVDGLADDTVVFYYGDVVTMEDLADSEVYCNVDAEQGTECFDTEAELDASLEEMPDALATTDDPAAGKQWCRAYWKKNFKGGLVGQWGVGSSVNFRAGHTHNNVISSISCRNGAKMRAWIHQNKHGAWIKVHGQDKNLGWFDNKISSLMVYN